MKNYTCPKCKKKQDTARCTETFVVFFDYDVENKNYDEKTKESLGEGCEWYCPECNEELPHRIYKHFDN